MKNIFFKMMVPIVAFAGTLCAAEVVWPPSPMLHYDHRMVVFHPLHQAYEYIPLNDFYVGANLQTDPVYRSDGNHVLHGFTEVRFGRSLCLGNGNLVRVALGIGCMKDQRIISYKKWHSGDFISLSERGEPSIAYGLVGVMFEHQLTPTVVVGFNTKILGGGVAGNHYWSTQDFHFGADVAVPVTFAFGNFRNWELKLEPFGLVMNNGNKYIGHRSALAYRF